MNTDNLASKNAHDAIGDYHPTDWMLDPLSHAKRLSPDAHSLKDLLKSSAAQIVMEQYEVANQKAEEFQKEYKRFGRVEIWANSCAAVTGAIVLLIASKTGDPWTTLQKMLLIVQILLISTAVAARFYLTHSNPFNRWQQQRSLAESARIELFETVCLSEKHHSPTENGLSLLSLQLEYFLRYQLSVQVNYYKIRGEEHEVAARRIASRGTILTFLAAVAASLTAAATELGNWVSSSAIVGTIAPILLSAQSGISRLNQDERNAARYAVTLGNLHNLQKQIDEVREAAQQGENKIVHDFIKAVNAVISVEHKEWVFQQTDKE